MKKIISKWLMGDIVEKKSTKARFDKVIKTLKNVIKDNEFTIVAIHDMKETYLKKDLEIPNDFEYIIVQICNAKKSHNALFNMNYNIGIMMPKSIIIAKENGKTILRFMKIKPFIVSMMFPELDIAPLSKKVSSILGKIVKETIEKAES